MTENVLEKPTSSPATTPESSTTVESSANDINLEQNGLQELAIIIAAKGINPASFTPDFWVNSGIIPADWMLLRKPEIGPQRSQIAFQNGMSLTVEPGKVTFSESMGAKDDAELTTAQLASQFVETLPQAEYLAVGINPQQIVPFTDRSQDVQTFMTQTLLQPAPWQELGTEPMQASMNLFYQLEACRLQLNLSPTELRLPNEARIPGMLFAANFHHPLTAKDAASRKQQMTEAIARWQSCLNTYRTLIEEKFMGML